MSWTQLVCSAKRSYAPTPRTHRLSNCSRAFSMVQARLPARREGHRGREVKARRHPAVWKDRGNQRRMVAPFMGSLQRALWAILLSTHRVIQAEVKLASWVTWVARAISAAWVIQARLWPEATR